MKATILLAFAALLLLSGCGFAPRPGSTEEKLWFLRAVGSENDLQYEEKYQRIVTENGEAYPLERR